MSPKNFNPSKSISQEDNEEIISRELIPALNKIKLTIDEKKINNLLLFLKLLQSYNAQVNLLATNDFRTIINKHVLDSLLANQQFENNIEVCDLGSGGGFPAIPLAIFNPQNNFYLIESKTKKANFLSNVKEHLNLKNLVIVNKNIAEVKKKFRFFTARAFSNVKKILFLTRKIYLFPATFFLYKGKKDLIKREIKEANLRQFEIINLPHSFFEGERNLLKFKIKYG